MELGGRGWSVGDLKNLHFPKFQVMLMLLGQGLQFENHCCKALRELKAGGQLYCNVSWGLKLFPVLTSDIDVPGLCYNCHDNEVGSSFSFRFLQSLSSVFKSHLYVMISSKKSRGKGRCLPLPS